MGGAGTPGLWQGVACFEILRRVIAKRSKFLKGSFYKLTSGLDEQCKIRANEQKITNQIKKAYPSELVQTPSSIIVVKAVKNYRKT